MVIMYTDGNGNFYVGDCRTGDREATVDEVAEFEATKVIVAEPTKADLLAQIKALMAKVEALP